MQRKSKGSPGLGVKILGVELTDDDRVRLFPLPDQQSAFAPIADGEDEDGTAGPTGVFRISRL
ncbi:hypothetical protein HSBAA_48280 [Vreelandella sulfidaeris]|jgi:hypothetical protein|uniref:Uncharacterized protein n=1 Tax=Vreelandella sulfidaeris TaxID=115553 RepID=A0A455UBE5_9GAMM|nr:hypothetical protein HSBAA_48280 [Halomonas sulfidaeris]|tara:strand:+ start:264 stop:452 length:189 start_codon:yes stop_codon:yes gene_type:complete